MGRVYLVNSRDDNAAVKRLGAQFDWDKRAWFVPEGVSLGPFARWLPPGMPIEQGVAEDAVDKGQPGISVVELLGRLGAVVSSSFRDTELVRGEVSDVRRHQRTISFKLVEHAQDGRKQARIDAFFWLSDNIVESFEEATQRSFEDGLRVLVSARVRMDADWGLRLQVLAIDPTYTLGDGALRFKQIVERLTRDGMIDRNRAMPSPRDFAHVIVISPEKAAGLGDFETEVERLRQGGLCRFSYSSAVFQGPKSSASLSDAIEAAFARHRADHADAMVIIRGGGAKADLAWLNDERVARLICEAPLPIFTGIGHERDSTVLDRVASRTFGTPSKVAVHIARCIAEEATSGASAFDRSLRRADQLLGILDERVGAVRDVASVRASRRLDALSRNAERALGAIERGAQLSLQRCGGAAASTLETTRRKSFERLSAIDAASRAVFRISVGLIRGADDSCTRLIRDIGEYARRTVRQMGAEAHAVFVQAASRAARADVETSALARGVRTNAERQLVRSDAWAGTTWLSIRETTVSRVAQQHRDSTSRWGAVRVACAREVLRTEKDASARAEALIGATRRRLNGAWRESFEQAQGALAFAIQRVQGADREANHLFQRIVLLGPERTLLRGFAIVRDASTARVLRTSADASSVEKLRIDFADGRVYAKRSQRGS